MSRALRPNDASLILDENADAQQVAFALNRAQFASPAELKPLAGRVRELLGHADAEVRGEASKVLLVGLASSADLRPVMTPIRQDRDPFWTGRPLMSLALAAYARSHAEARREVLATLAFVIKNDPEWAVQKAAYQDFLSLAAPEVQPDDGDDVFDAASMVDWSLVTPYLSSYSGLHTD